MKKPDVYNPYITVSFDDKGRVYYDILYYDIDDRQWHIGYGSYDLDIVRKYLKEELNILDTEMKFVPRDRGNYGLEKFLIKKTHPEYSDEQVLAYIQGYEEKETEYSDKLIQTDVEGLYLNIPEEYEKDNEKLKEENAELKRQLDRIDYWKSQVQRLCGEKFNLEKESEELKSTIKAMVEEMAKVGEVCNCINSKACPLDECGKFTFRDKIMKLIKEDNEK